MFALLQKYKYKFSGVDESGNLSMAELSSKYFVMACFMHNDMDFARKLRKFIGRLNHKKNKKKILSLHANTDTDNTRLKFIRFICNLECKVLVVYCKRKLPVNGLFNYHGLLKQIVLKINAEKILVSSPVLKQSFQDGIKELDERIGLVTTINAPEIQVADMFAWATFKKLEDGNDLYYRLLVDKIELVEVKM